MFEMWFVLAVLAGIFSILFNTINRTHLKDNLDSTSYSWWFEFCKACFFLALIIFDHKLDVTVAHVGILILLGLSEFVAVYFFMKMHKQVELSVSSVVTQFRLLLVPLLAYFLINERLNINVYFGIAVLLFGLLLTLSKVDFSKMKKGVVYAVIFSLASAISSVLMKETSNFASVPVVMFAFSFPAVILLPLFMKNPISRLMTFVKAHSKIGSIAAAANIMTLLLLGFAYKFGTVSQITAVFLSTFVGNVLIGMFLLKEEVSKRQVAGIIIVLVSIFLIYR